MFTGSVNTGHRIATAAAQRLIPYSLELGGKDAMIVCADADIDRAVDGAVFGGFYFAGQACISVERLYIEEPVYDEFVQKLVAKTSQLRLGMDTKHDYSCDVGSMATEQQRAIVSRHVEDAVSKGATVLTGGKARDNDFYYEPTVLADVDHGMDCMREETFGPTLPVMKVRDAAEAIEKANDSRLGLAGSIWTRDKAKAMALARQMNTGTVTLNNVLVGITQFGVPFGGWNDSGVGARSGGADRNPKVLPSQKHCGRTDHHEEGTELVSLQPQEGQACDGSGQVRGRPRLAPPVGFRCPPDPLSDRATRPTILAADLGVAGGRHRAQRGMPTRSK